MNELTEIRPDEEGIIEQHALIEAEKMDAAQRVQAPLVIAKRFPRVEERAVTAIRKACMRPSLAKVAMYAYPRGGQTIRGASIRLAEVLAQNWGNLDFGMREIEAREGKDGYSIIEAFCWDLETNTRQSRTFKILHRRKAKGNYVPLEDPRDVYEHVANYAMRRVRACILAVIPRDVVEDAVCQIEKTLLTQGGPTMEDRIKSLVFEFDKIGVSHEMLERKLGHETKLINDHEMLDLRAIYTSIKEGHHKREDYFEFKASDGGKAAELTETFSKKKPKPE